MQSTVRLYIPALTSLAMQINVEDASRLMQRIAVISDELEQGNSPEELLGRCKDLHFVLQNTIRSEKEASRFSTNPLVADVWPRPQYGYETRGGDGIDLFRGH